MRLILFFDLPTNTIEDRRAYRLFRKFLVQNGFVMQQESVYTKLVLNGTAANNVINRIRKVAPKAGLVELLCITEKQFANIEMITGNSSSDIITSTERLVVV